MTDKTFNQEQLDNQSRIVARFLLSNALRQYERLVNRAMRSTSRHGEIFGMLKMAQIFSVLTSQEHETAIQLLVSEAKDIKEKDKWWKTDGDKDR